MAKGNSTATFTVTIENQAIPVEPVELPLDQIRLDPENPRIRENLKKRGNGSATPTQAELQKIILQIPGVQPLQRSIRETKGLHDRIYVRHDGRVAEGNCRTAVYLFLRAAQKNEACWKTIPALRLPPTVTERQIAVLQGHMHVAGKITWKAHEQAGHLHYMNKTLNMQPTEIATAMGMSENDVKKLLVTYETMNQHVLPRLKKGDGRDAREKFSYVHELYKVRGLEEWRTDDANVKLFCDLVVTGKLDQGQQVRKLHKVLGDARATAILKKDGFKTAIQHVGKKDPTADSPIFNRLKATAKALAKVRKPVLDRLRTGSEEQRIVKELHSALRRLADMAGVKLSRDGS